MSATQLAMVVDISVGMFLVHIVVLVLVDISWEVTDNPALVQNTL